MTTWSMLKDELDRWHDHGQEVTLWWRDDDAVKPCRELETLIELSRDHQAPLGLAVVPGRIADELPPFLDSCETVEVMQHGFAHINRATPDEKKSEFPWSRPRKELMEDVVAGARIMRGFQSHSPVLVPPWNRFDKRLLPALPGLGLRGISAYGPRKARNAAPALKQVNTHVDPVNWRGDRKFLGEQPVLSALISHLKARRNDRVDHSEPTGLLTHHLDHDTDGWGFIARLLDLTSGHSRVKWLSVSEAFGFK